MARSKVPSDAALQVALLKRIAEYKSNRIPVPDLLRAFNKDIIGSNERQLEYSLPTSSHAREHESERRSIDALREMYENEAWVDLESLGDERLGDALATEPSITLENQHRFVVTITKRGQGFLETGRNPLSRHARTRSTMSKKGSQIPRNESIADIVSSKERRLRIPKNEAAAREQIADSIAGRRGQQEFRQNLLQTYKRCLITGCDAEEVLEAAHIQPYSEAGTFELSNGLLLRADIHTLFDLGLITVDTADMTVITAESLKNTVYGELNKRKLCFHECREYSPDKKALQYHNQLFTQRQHGSLAR
jgi:hypothetical protein